MREFPIKFKDLSKLKDFCRLCGKQIFARSQKRGILWMTGYIFELFHVDKAYWSLKWMIRREWEYSSGGRPSLVLIAHAQPWEHSFHPHLCHPSPRSLPPSSSLPQSPSLPTTGSPASVILLLTLYLLAPGRSPRRILAMKFRSSSCPFPWNIGFYPGWGVKARLKG